MRLRGGGAWCVQWRHLQKCHRNGVLPAHLETYMDTIAVLADQDRKRKKTKGVHSHVTSNDRKRAGGGDDDDESDDDDGMLDASMMSGSAPAAASSSAPASAARRKASTTRGGRGRGGGAAAATSAMVASADPFDDLDDHDHDAFMGATATGARRRGGGAAATATAGAGGSAASALAAATVEAADAAVSAAAVEVEAASDSRNMALTTLDRTREAVAAANGMVQALSECAPLCMCATILLLSLPSSMPAVLTTGAATCSVFPSVQSARSVRSRSKRQVASWTTRRQTRCWRRWWRGGRRTRPRSLRHWRA